MRSHDLSDPDVGLADGSVDIAFLRSPVLVQDWLGIEPLFLEPLVLVVSATSRLASLTEVGVEQLSCTPRKPLRRWATSPM